MVERVRRRLNLTTLQYQTMPDMLEAIGLPKEQVCTYCWDGADRPGLQTRIEFEQPAPAPPPAAPARRRWSP
jgi:glutamine phosphoribosylpyrophosphate amidotransferase